MPGTSAMLSCGEKQGENRMRLTIPAAAAAMLLFCGSAQAQDRDPCGTGMVCASDPATVMQALEKAGLAPKLGEDDLGDPMIESGASVYDFAVFFYGCEKNAHCDSLQFHLLFRKEPENTAELANKWNAAHRFLKAAVNDKGQLVMAHDVATIGGLNQRNFADVIDWWKVAVGQFETAIGY